MLNTDKQALVLVPNARLAEAWISDYFLSVSPESEIIVEPPVKTLSGWVSELLLEAHVLAGEKFPALANHQQQLTLWKAAISTDADYRYMNQVKALAGLAQSAERELRQWDVYVPDAAVNDQFRDFLRWRARFYESMKDSGLTTTEHQLVTVTRRLADSTLIKIPEKVTMFGFLEYSRIEDALLRQMALSGTTVERLALEQHKHPAKSVLARYTDFDSECVAAAQWAETALENGACRVALVVNDIDKLCLQVTHLLEQHFHSGQLAAGMDTHDACFHVPSGKSLCSQQVVADALLLLELSLSAPDKRWSAAKISRFLLCPFTHGAADEHSARARLELYLRKSGRFEVSLDTLQNWLKSEKFASTAPTFERLLPGVTDVGKTLEITGRMTACLHHWGWGEATSGLARRCATRFLKLIEDLAFIRPTIVGEALANLRELATDARIVTHGGELSKIQVLEPEAVLGRQFDAVRVLNMSQDNWPAKPAQNGLIPPVCWPLLGRSTVESSFEHARRVTSLLKSVAPEVLFSWTDNDNGVETAPSALLTDIGVPQNAEPAPKTFWETIQQAPTDGVMLEVRPQQRGLGLDSAINNHLPGGSALFAEQAVTPLGAYCRRRLGARWWDIAGPFVDASFRGQVLHAALENLYAGAVETANIPANTLVPGAVKGALDKYRAWQKMTAPALAAETTRLNALLLEWLQLDRGRPAFSVRSLECRKVVEWDGFKLGMQIDRIDQLPGKQLLIIDYKSGSVNTAGWADPRLSNPQLPLYALLYEMHTGFPVSGIALAGVRVADCVYRGIAAESIAGFDGLHVYGGKKYGLVRKFASWAELGATWRQQLETLFVEIREGHCENRVYDANGAGYLGLESVLRVAEGEHWLAGNQ